MGHESKQGNIKKFAVIGFIAVVAIFVAASYFGFPPNEEDVQGTIGKADKYRAEQITADDVELNNPEIQAMLQDDKIIKMLQDEHFMQALADVNLRKAFRDEQLRSAIPTADLKRFFDNSEHLKVGITPDFRRALALKMLRSQLITPDHEYTKSFEHMRAAYYSNPEVEKLVNSDHYLYAMSSPNVRDLFQQDYMLAAMSRPEFEHVVLDDHALRASSSGKVLEIINDEFQLRNLIKDPTKFFESDHYRAMPDYIREAFKNENFRAWIATDEYQRLANTEEYKRASRETPDWMNVYKLEAMRSALADKELYRVITADHYLQGVANEYFRASFESEHFRAAFSEPEEVDPTSRVLADVYRNAPQIKEVLDKEFERANLGFGDKLFDVINNEHLLRALPSVDHELLVRIDVMRKYAGTVEFERLVSSDHMHNAVASESFRQYVMGFDGTIE
jgi:hypothetical protein